MKVYVVTTNDRHVDIDVEVFKDKNLALAWAKRIYREYSKGDNKVSEKEYDLPNSEGWLYFGSYSCEGDHIIVCEKVINE